mmetsp:Transcript_85348/g.226190  ORF Transcript_85348/g.226190 Transcript_85348/m.226190 type:complete len:201 (+) Transcript_85348:72-674(+)
MAASKWPGAPRPPPPLGPPSGVAPLPRPVGEVLGLRLAARPSPDTRSNSASNFSRWAGFRLARCRSTRPRPTRAKQAPTKRTALSRTSAAGFPNHSIASCIAGSSGTPSLESGCTPASWTREASSCKREEYPLGFIFFLGCCSRSLVAKGAPTAGHLARSTCASAAVLIARALASARRSASAGSRGSRAACASGRWSGRV